MASSYQFIADVESSYRFIKLAQLGTPLHGRRTPGGAALARIGLLADIVAIGTLGDGCVIFR